MTHVEELQCRYDGAIRPQLLAAAEALDAVEARTRRQPVVCRVKKWKPAGIVERMAATLVRMRRMNGVATRMDLVERGFSLTEIENYGTAAQARAGRLWAGL